ncbi:methyltransferase [Leifsonia sp. LS1]|uniref:class I SAM-dependent methyltransferase n=1 Tax=Leifsonia sp. LS1 TaxID=2828483 RepID=UPI001CFD1A67|nr:class I SAM-dependent methyltransferase [Leifsonia sp. LS1]GIT81457.1 methyltransferase [Leifsonia sp. LS1]
MNDEATEENSGRQSVQGFWDEVRANPNRTAQQFWDDFYVEHTRGEHGPVSRWLSAETEDLEPGTALDLGCGEGADALWLAGRGWAVLGVDVSATALERAREHALRLALADRARFEQYDLASSFPEGTFDLVSAQFLHSPVAAAGERERVLTRAAQAVAPGGRVLVVSHQGMPSWMGEQPAELTLPTPDDTLAALQLAPGEWATVRSETMLTDVPGPAGQPGTRADHVLHLRRIPAA